MKREDVMFLVIEPERWQHIWRQSSHETPTVARMAIDILSQPSFFTPLHNVSIEADIFPNQNFAYLKLEFCD
jgi:hypothetical protein